MLSTHPLDHLRAGNVYQFVVTNPAVNPAGPAPPAAQKFKTSATGPTLMDASGRRVF